MTHPRQSNRIWKEAHVISVSRVPEAALEAKTVWLYAVHHAEHAAALTAPVAPRVAGRAEAPVAPVARGTTVPNLFTAECAGLRGAEPLVDAVLQRPSQLLADRRESRMLECLRRGLHVKQLQRANRHNLDGSVQIRSSSMARVRTPDR